jgi:hypothetical protein
MRIKTQDKQSTYRILLLALILPKKLMSLLRSTTGQIKGPQQYKKTAKVGGHWSTIVIR